MKITNVIYLEMSLMFVCFVPVSLGKLIHTTIIYRAHILCLTVVMQPVNLWQLLVDKTSNNKIA